jgi:putative chitinase
VLTGQQLQSIMPSIPTARREALLPFLQAAMAEFAIETPARVAAFVAQLAHESGQFLFMEEIWGPTQAQRRYEPVSTLAATLGNTELGDGKRFKGRGPIQITGRANYRRFGDLLGLDLVSDPARAAHPELAFRIAGLFWSKKGLSELADRATDEAFREITRRINGGFNGLDDRRKFYAVARTVLGVVDETITRGAARTRPEVGDEPAFDRGAEAIRRHARRRGVTATKKKTKKKGEKKKPERKNVKKRKTARTAARSRKPRAR